MLGPMGTLAGVAHVGAWSSPAAVGSGWDLPPSSTSGAGSLRLYTGYATPYPCGTSAGFFGPGTVGNGWNAMTAIVGPGDFNSDGNVDLLARDAGGALWLYPSNGQGGWLPRGLVGSGWNAMNLII
ncbi:VCBS repeat-containing protein [Arthrobacter sp. Rue61a]|uniref:FG-GAP repeat domain-containing protein n=1 Tax=Arthrobacter sp. Rue61a TaxID=1118963 RepID=UPI0002F914A8|nr:VCBS repeat-containing protein [Arthrobacter sp. Rue61a]